MFTFTHYFPYPKFIRMEFHLFWFRLKLEKKPINLKNRRRLFREKSDGKKKQINFIENKNTEEMSRKEIVGERSGDRNVCERSQSEAAQNFIVLFVYTYLAARVPLTVTKSKK